MNNGQLLLGWCADLLHGMCGGQINLGNDIIVCSCSCHPEREEGL